MANRTVKDAKSLHGTNPQYLVEKIIRTRIYDSKYWKEECFALSAELLVDKAMELRFIGGVYGGNIKSTPFICLTLKMLQIQPEKDIIIEFIRNEEYKYVRALGAFYMRLVGSSLDCYKYLEPLLADWRKLRRQKRDGSFDVIHMDEFIDELLREERLFDVILPRIQKRHVLEESNELEAKISALDDDFEEGLDTSDEDEEKTYDISKNSTWTRKKSPTREVNSPIRDRSPLRNRSPYFDRRENKKESHKDRERDRVRDRERDRGRERDRERDRDKDRDRRDRERKDRDRKDRDRKHKDKNRR